MKNTILRFLMEQKDFVSGQEMCEKLNVSRTAVWKYINALKEEGYEIESVTRKGYRLVDSPDKLTAASVRAALPEVILPGELGVYAVIDSTNEEAKRAAAKGAPDKSLYVSDHQTGGKGRRGRSWISPKGKDVFFTLLLRPKQIAPTQASMLTLLAALAGVKAASRYSGCECQIKWPNDIICDRKKVCGILTEMSIEMESREIDYVVIGIGWNLNREQFDPTISDMAGSLYLQTGKQVDRSRFTAMVIEEFMQYYDRFLQEKDLAFCMEEYNHYLVSIGKEVRLIQNGQEEQRISKGINHLGELIVEDADGEESTVFSGEVSVRGLYGYV